MHRGPPQSGKGVLGPIRGATVFTPLQEPIHKRRPPLGPIADDESCLHEAKPMGADYLMRYFAPMKTTMHFCRGENTLNRVNAFGQRIPLQDVTMVERVSRAHFPGSGPSNINLHESRCRDITIQCNGACGSICSQHHMNSTKITDTGAIANLAT